MIRYCFQLNLVPFWGMLNISLVVRIEMGVRGVVIIHPRAVPRILLLDEDNRDSQLAQSRPGVHYSYTFD